MTTEPMEEIRRDLAAIALRGMCVLPGMIVHIDISREKSIRALEYAMNEGQEVFLIAQQDAQVEDPGLSDVCRVGCIAQVRSVTNAQPGIKRIMVEVGQRARLLSLNEIDGRLSAGVLPLISEKPVYSEHEEEAMCRALKDIFSVYVQETKKTAKDLIREIQETEELEKLVDRICMNVQTDYHQRQKLLECIDLQTRYDAICNLLASEIEIIRIRNGIAQQVKERIDKNQREYILREQLKVIQEELGGASPESEADQYREKLNELDAPKEIKEKIEKELTRFKTLGGNTQEASVSRTYIETLLEMPWNKRSEDDQDLKRAAKILNDDHYGLDKVKERVLEFLAVRTLTKKGDSPILCLVGPPGTGKTSIARSVARALNKKYVRLSLGGIRDEAEIRGHRRTYIGAMPGRIAAGLRNAGVANPLMLLDEIDKVSSDYKGDTSAALLEVLDSEQNVKFRDHYIELPLDLSEVLFIATANDLNTIPQPLLDRMEVIEVSSYTSNEKYHIAAEHLVSKQRARHGLEDSQLTISKGALESIIAGYTREAGVRQLERKIGEICRKAARQILEDGVSAVRVNAGNLERYLGRRLFTQELKNDQDEIGIVRGLAWTRVGGTTLQIEVNVMPGKGDFMLTGKLGDVMKESAQTGISYIRSVADRYGIKPEFFREHDFHIHIPEGAVPKDGPSAGITMATAIISAITGIPARADVAMTGEITLRGRVLPIGGVKEKLLAAKAAGMTTVIVPEQNRKDTEELDREITKGMELIYASNMETVLNTALTDFDKVRTGAEG